MMKQINLFRIFFLPMSIGLISFLPAATDGFQPKTDREYEIEQSLRATHARNDYTRYQMLCDVGVPPEVARYVKASDCTLQINNKLYGTNQYERKKSGLYVLCHEATGTLIGMNSLGVFDLAREGTGPLTITAKKDPKEVATFFAMLQSKGGWCAIQESLMIAGADGFVPLAPVSSKNSTQTDSNKIVALVGISLASVLAAGLAAWQVATLLRMKKPSIYKGLFAKRWRQRRLKHGLTAGFSGVVALGLAITTGVLLHNRWYHDTEK